MNIDHLITPFKLQRPVLSASGKPGAFAGVPPPRSMQIVPKEVFCSFP